MKKLFIPLSVLLTWSCGSSSNSNNEHNTHHENHTLQNVPKGHTDPICKMVKDETWDLYTVHHTDTVWFCSATCQEMFGKNPDKYEIN